MVDSLSCLFSTRYLLNNWRLFVYQKQVADGVFYAELNEFLTRELAEDGYAGVEVRVTPARTEYVSLWIGLDGCHGNKC